jgi:carbonic anhydrase
VNNRIDFNSKLSAYINKELVPIFKFKYLKRDLLASLALLCVAIPLSLAVSVAVGIPFQAALVSASVGGVLGAVFGGSRLGVTGPAIAMSVLLAEVYSTYGAVGIVAVGIICGVLQIISGFMHLGKLAKYVPVSLVLAFGSGIGFLLLFQELPRVFNLAADKPSKTVFGFIDNINYYASHLISSSVGVVILTIFIIAVLPRYIPRAYAFLCAIIIPVSLVFMFDLDIPLVNSIPDAHAVVDFTQIKSLPHIYKLMLFGFEVFILASLETLLSTNAVDLMGKGELHNPNHELVGQGIANFGVALCGGIPVTGVVLRSTVNVISGAKTRRSAIIHALIMAVIIYEHRFLGYIPVAVLSGVLVAAAFKMLAIPQIVDLFKRDKSDFIVYIITFLTIISTDILDGIQTGLLLAFVIVGFKMLRSKGAMKFWTNNNVLRVSLTGNLTFMSFEHFVIFEFALLQNLDSSGAKYLIDTTNELHKHKITSILHSPNSEHVKVIKANTFDTSNYEITITEYQIKDILENSGYSHSANDVLRHGITKYVTYYAKDNQELISTLAQGQKPHTLLITCSDSRLNPNAFFSANIGEIFIVRNVGNVVPPFMPDNIYSEIAAIEYAVSELGVRNIVICAHTECGAVKASYATGDNNLGYVGLDNWLGLIKDGFRITPPTDYHEGVRINLLHQVENLKTYPKISAMFATNQLTIHGWIYDVHSGNMLEWSDKHQDFISIV